MLLTLDNNHISLPDEQFETNKFTIKMPKHCLQLKCLKRSVYKI